MSRCTREMLLFAGFALVAGVVCRAQNPFGAPGGSTVKGATSGETVEESISRLKEMVADEPCEGGGNAAYELLEISAGDAERLFSEFQLGLGSPDASRRRDAAVSLGRLCGAADLRMRESEVLRRSVAAMVSALEDPDPGVRAGAAFGLAEILSDPTATNRVVAGDALDKMGPNARHTAARVANSLGDEDEMVRSKALDVLQSIGSAAEQQIPAIESVIRKFPSNVYDAASALDEIARDPEDFKAASTALAEALGCSDTDSAQRAAIAPARRGDAALEPLLKALGDGNPCRRRSAAFAIAHLGERAEAAVPRLLALLHDSEPDVVWNSIQALEQIVPDTDEAVAELIATLNHSDNGVRAQAAKALAAINNEAVRAAVGTMVEIALSSEGGTRFNRHRGRRTRNESTD